MMLEFPPLADSVPKTVVSVPKTGHTVLHICFEAHKSGCGPDHTYLVYSFNISDKQTGEPKFTMEAQITGPPSMGCGPFGSQIVLAGGVLDGIKKKDIITFDMNSKMVSTNSFPPTKRGKLKPLVFQLQNRLYVFDTGSHINKRSFEFLSNKSKIWHHINNPFSLYTEPSDYVSPDISLDYSFLAVGNTAYISSPRGHQGFLHHPNKSGNSCYPGLPKLPFSGVATFHYQSGYDDLLVITFKNGLVEAREFNPTGDSGDSDITEILFAIDPSWRSGGPMAGYFANFGDGNFCLTAFDSFNFCLYKFKIRRKGKDENQWWDCTVLYKDRFSFDLLSGSGCKILSVLGCFPPDQNYNVNLLAERLVYSYWIPELTCTVYDCKETNGEERSPVEMSDEEESDSEESNWKDTYESWLDEVHHEIPRCLRNFSTSSPSGSGDTGNSMPVYDENVDEEISSRIDLFGIGNNTPPINSVPKMDHTVLHICFEAQKSDRKQGPDHTYLVYSVDFSDNQTGEPKFTMEALIPGPPSMGCGLFGSQIVLAGGVLDGIKKKDIVTFDMNSKSTSTDTFPPTKRGKLKPFIFELQNRLYVFDTGSHINKRSFEFLSNKSKIWHHINNPFALHTELSDYVSPDISLDYSFLAVGNTAYISSPRGYVGFLLHSNKSGNSWYPSLPKLPPPGVATFHYQCGYNNILVITFTNGLVVAREFNWTLDSNITTEILFAIDPSWRSGGPMTGYFANLGDGNFCLSAFDSLCFCLYKFKILRKGKGDDQFWDCSISYKGRFSFDQFDDSGCRISSVLGCFPQDQNYNANLLAERLVHSYWIPELKWSVYGREETNGEERSTVEVSDEEESDSEESNWKDTYKSWLDEIHHEIPRYLRNISTSSPSGSGDTGNCMPPTACTGDGCEETNVEEAAS
ncbi:hypothetical protein POM88_018931 [Heracleum sosnowskyi]|uniref:Uncharacterized protein n=1 Tax=Heracleum sosnowskyi TaxID=360622 RepID=A0AAD8N0V2_9APIA|nr:hypothetical protein POM88_018931 [Heracleum sosnowskyi]